MAIIFELVAMLCRRGPADDAAMSTIRLNNCEFELFGPNDATPVVVENSVNHMDLDINLKVLLDSILDMELSIPDSIKERAQVVRDLLYPPEVKMFAYPKAPARYVDPIQYAVRELTATKTGKTYTLQTEEVNHDPS